MTALITGGAGFAGSHLADELLGQNQEVIALVREGGRLDRLVHLRNRIRIEQGDIRDSQFLARLLRETRPQHIYHLAGIASPAECARQPRLAYDVNFGGTLNLLSAWREAGFEGRLLAVSTSQVYGAVAANDLPVREGAPVRPGNAYAGSKAAAELVAMQFFASYGLPIVRVRPFNHTGPGQAPSFVCSSFARQVAEIALGLKAPVMDVGNLPAQRDFTDVRDMVRGYRMLLEGGQAGEVYQLCSGRPVFIGDILRSLLRLTPKAVEVRAGESAPKAADPVPAWGDASKARQAVGWRPEVAFETTLADLKRYWEESLAGASKVERRASQG